MSAIDITKPVTGTPTTQSVRDNFEIAADEIDTAQAAAEAAQTSADGKTTLIAGSPLTTTPLPYNTKLTHAHGLGAIPSFVLMWMTCITAERGYVAGDRIYMTPDTEGSAGNANHTVEADDTNFYQIIGSGYPRFQDKTTDQYGFRRTPNGDYWSITVQPYLIA